MTTRALVVVLLALLVLPLAFGGCAESRSARNIDDLPIDVRDAIAAARDRVFPSLVNIEVVSLEYTGGKEQKSRSTGSGTIFTPQGHVLTNAHVTDRGRRFWCTLSDKQRVPATMVGEDPWTDLAVLQLDLSRLEPGTKVHVATIGDSDSLLVGDYVLAMGSPFSLSRTVTLGIVSNTERVFASAGDGQVDEMLLTGSTGLFTN